MSILNISNGFLSRLRPVRWFGRLSLLHQFMLLSGAILLLGAAVIGWWIDRQIVQEVTDANMRVAAVFVDSTVAPHVWELESLDDISDIQRAHLHQLLQNNIRSEEFAAVNVWRPDGKLVYSSLGEALHAATPSPGVAVARRGQVHTQQTQGIHGQVDADQRTTYLETYFPVRAPDGEEVIAVVSFYRQLEGLRRSIFLARLQSWLVVGTATVLMYVVLYSIVKRGSDTIERQQRDLATSRRHIQQAAVRAAALNEASMRRLGSDLHDGPAQDLGIALMRIEPLRAAVDAQSQGKAGMDIEQVAFDLNLIHTALQSSLQEVRALASGLRIPDHSGLDLAGVIHKAATDYMRKTGRQVQVDGPASLAGSEALRSAAFRIVQETLTNGHVHGDPELQRVRYQMRRDAAGRASLFLEVVDDGKGFDPEVLAAQGPRRQLGLAGLQERAEILGGRLYIDSAPGRGTVVRAMLPLEEAPEPAP